MELRQDGAVIRYDARLVDPMDPCLFDPDWLKSSGHSTGGASGRSQAHFFRYNGLDMVLRQFMRGGLVGRVNRDRYLRFGKNRSRSIREFELLKWMRTEGLPVPAPVAALYAPSGLFYRAAIITERIPDARPIEDMLRETPLPQDVWNKVGLAIREMHDKGVDHSDLNCRNILADIENRIWIIDFDKCGKRPQGSWTNANLARLKRSLQKHADLQWREDDWTALIHGYEAGGGPPDGRPL